MRGIEPLALAWKAKVLPLYDIRLLVNLVIDLVILTIFRTLVNLFAENRVIKAKCDMYIY